MNETQSYPKLHRALLLCLAVCASIALLGTPSAGAEMMTMPTWGSPGNGDGQFDTPMDVAVAPGPEGDVYVVDRGNFRIQRFSPSGQYLGKWGSPGTGAGEFGSKLVAAAVAPDGKVFVLEDRGSGSGFRVQRFDADGTFELGWGNAEGSALGEFDEPRDIAVGPGGRVYVVEAGNHRVQSFDPDGSDPAAWGSLGNGGGKFADPVGIAIDQESGEVYVADGGATPQVQVFSASGDFLREWGATGRMEGQLPAHGLVAIAVGSEGHVYTKEYEPGENGIDRVQRFSATGGFIAGQHWHDFTDPHGLAVAGDSVYAVDSGGGKVVVFPLNRPYVSMSGPIAEVGAGQRVIFQSTSSVPLGQIVDHEWDLDGDGTFELDTGPIPEAEHVYSEVGRYTPRLRVTADRGGTAIGSRQVDVVVASPPGPVGVSINDGARYTRDPNVTVTVRWPLFAQYLNIANDGGFSPATAFAVQEKIKWRLDTGGPLQQPRTIYVRFGRFGYEEEVTYTDTIYLDMGRPTIRVDEVPLGGGPSQLRLKARDDLSGVVSMQVMRKGKQKGWQPFKKSLRLRGSAKKIRIRVQDEAGNLSRWVRVKRR